MMKTQVLTAMLAIAVAQLFFASQAYAADPTGTWKYDAKQAPYEYSKGDMIISEEDGKLSGTIKVNYQTITMRDVKLDNSTLTFGVYIEGEYVKITMELDGDRFKGTASYSEGSIPLEGVRAE